MYIEHELNSFTKYKPNLTMEMERKEIHLNWK